MNNHKYTSDNIFINIKSNSIQSNLDSMFQRMSSDAGSSDEDKPIFRPLTRDSLAQIQARIDSEHAKKKELDRKRAEGEVGNTFY